MSFGAFSVSFKIHSIWFPTVEPLFKQFWCLLLPNSSLCRHGYAINADGWDVASTRCLRDGNDATARCWIRWFLFHQWTLLLIPAFHCLFPPPPSALPGVCTYMKTHNFLPIPLFSDPPSTCVFSASCCTVVQTGCIHHYHLYQVESHYAIPLSCASARVGPCY